MVVQFAPARLIKNAATQARPQDVELRFTHRSFEPKQQSVIEVRGIIQPVLVEDQRIRQAAALEPSRRLVERGSGKPEGSCAATDGLVVFLHPAYHLVLDLNEVSRVEKI